MTAWFRNIRFYVLIFSLTLSLSIFIWTESVYGQGSLRIIRLTEIYALVAITYLYLALLATPLTQLFHFFPGRGHYLKARRALGVSTFFFGLLHAGFAFFGELGGFAGLFFLGGRYLLAIGFSFTALLILASMASTSFDFMVAKLKYRRWKFLHRFVYLASVLILIHALLLGSHFVNLSSLIPRIVFVAVAILLFLEAIRFDRYLQFKRHSSPRFGLTMVFLSLGLGAALVYYFVPNNLLPQIGLHATHLQEAKEAQSTDSATKVPNAANMPGLKGDRTRRFNVAFHHEEKILPGQETELTFAVTEAASGDKTTFFEQNYTKLAHLIIVDNQLSSFTHLHPTLKDSVMSLKTSFPKVGQYRLLLSFQPLGAIEQQFTFTVPVGDFDKASLPQTSPDTNLTKTFGDYEISLSYPSPLKADQISVGQQLLSFTLRKVGTKQAVTALKPYLGAFGHLTMINQQTFESLHVHPTDFTPPAPDALGGPEVEFMPFGIYTSVKLGLYRLFAEFNPEGHLVTADYTVKVE